MFTVLKRRDKFSRENLLYQCNILQQNVRINEQNAKLVVSSLQQISELMIWGDQNDETFFDICTEMNILEKCLKLIKQRYNKHVTTQVLQSLSIIIENMSNMKSLYTLFSNNYINDLIIYNFNFKDSDILGYYVILLRQISSKLDENVINFFFNSKTNDFPLYVSALRFFDNDCQTVRTKIMQIILYMFKLSTKHKELKEFILKESALSYFIHLILFIKKDCIKLNKIIINKQKDSDLENKLRAHIDYYYYLEDILSFNLDSLSHKLINQLLSHFILPVCIGSLTIKDDEKEEHKYNHNKICRHLSIFLLTNMLNIFSNNQLKHSIIISVLSTNPPKLVNQIVLYPPKYAIDTQIPIHYLLSLQSQKMNNNNNNNNNNINGKNNSNNNTVNRSEIMQSILQNDENNKVKRSQITQVRTIDIIHNKSMLCEDKNIYRNSLLNMFNTIEYSAYIASFILVIIKDELNVLSKELFTKIIKPSDLIKCILNVLSNDKIFNYSQFNIFTIRILIKLLIYFKQNYKNSLNEKDYNLLNKIWKYIKNELSQCCIMFISNDESMKTYLLDTFEQEWNTKQQEKQNNMISLTTNPKFILNHLIFPKNNYKKNSKYTQQLTDKLNKIRQSIKYFLYVLHMYNELLQHDAMEAINLPFIARIDWKYYNRLQVPLLTLASGCLNTVVLYNNNEKKQRVLFSTREPNWLLLFNRISNSKGYCVIYLAVPIHTCQCIMDKYDPRIIRLTIKSSQCPHNKIAYPVSKSKKNNKWIITLFFDSMFDNKNKTNNNQTSNVNKHALIAMEYITMNRMRVRRKMMQKIEELILN